MPIDYRADYMVRYVNPYTLNGDGSLTLADLLSAVNGATCSYAVYAAITRTSVASVVDTTNVLVPAGEAALFTLGQRVAFIDGGAAEQLVTLDLVDTALDQLGFSADPIALAPEPGSSARRIFGALGSERVAMAEYGTPSIDDATADLWGWEAGLTDTLYPELTPRVKYEIESRVIGAGGNLDGVQRIFDTVRDTRQ